MNKRCNITFEVTQEELCLITNALLMSVVAKQRELDSAQGLNSRIDALLRTIECRDAKIDQLNKRLNKATDELKALKADQSVAPTEAR